MTKINEKPKIKKCIYNAVEYSKKFFNRNVADFFERHNELTTSQIAVIKQELNKIVAALFDNSIKEEKFNSFIKYCDMLLSYYDVKNDVKIKRYIYSKFEYLIFFRDCFTSENIVKQICNIPINDKTKEDKQLFIQVLDTIYPISSELRNYILNVPEMYYRDFIIKSIHSSDNPLFFKYLKEIDRDCYYSLQHLTLLRHAITENIDLIEVSKRCKIDLKCFLDLIISSKKTPREFIDDQVIGNVMTTNKNLSLFMQSNKKIIEEFIGNDVKHSSLLQETKQTLAYANAQNEMLTIKMKSKKTIYQVLQLNENRMKIKTSNIFAIDFQRNNIYLDFPEEYTVVIYHDKFYYTHKTSRSNEKRRLYPLSMKKLSQHIEIHHIFKEYLKFLSKEKNNLFLNDIVNTNWDQWIIPVGFDDLIMYHNWNEFFCSRYKTAGMIKMNFNKHNPMWSYLIIKAFNYVDEKSKGILQQSKEADFGFNRIRFNTANKKFTKEAVLLFLTSYYALKLNIKDKNSKLIIKDYLNMCMSVKKKINLSYKSFKRLQKEHDILMRDSYMRHTSNIQIPKNTKFKKLRKILPEDEFEWIKSKKRLIQETLIQDHCVWSYADLINSDKCAIYSFIYKDDNKRYTIEFRENKSKFYIVQVQGHSNKLHTEEQRKYIQDILYKHQN